MLHMNTEYEGRSPTFILTDYGCFVRQITIHSFRPSFFSLLLLLWTPCGYTRGS